MLTLTLTLTLTPTLTLTLTIAPTLTLTLGALPAMLDAARRWLHEAALLELALGVLRCLGSFAPACMGSFAQRGGPHLVLDAMARHGGHALLQESCCSLLWSA